MTNLKIGTFNVRGLRKSKKRCRVFNYLHQKHYDIVFLQETHFDINMSKIVKNQWGGTVVASCGNTDSKGVAILFRKRCLGQ